MKKKNKEELYKFYMRHIDISLENSNYFESSWLSYALIEDRLISLLIQTGGNASKSNKIKMLGPKITELKKRLRSDTTLQKVLTNDQLYWLKVWKNDRNDLMHSMADGRLTVADIQMKIEKLATEGRDISRELAASSRRMKKRKQSQTRN